jgi:hypothetical protein
MSKMRKAASSLSHRNAVGVLAHRLVRIFDAGCCFIFSLTAVT